MRGLSGKLDFLDASIVVECAACLLSAVVWALAYWTGIIPTRTGTDFMGWSALGTGVIYYGAAFYVYLVGLQDTPASKAGIYLSLVPVFAIGLAWVLLAERLTNSQWIGALIVVGAVGGISILLGREGRRVPE